MWLLYLWANLVIKALDWILIDRQWWAVFLWRYRHPEDEDHWWDCGQVLTWLAATWSVWQVSLLRQRVGSTLQRPGICPEVWCVWKKTTHKPNMSCITECAVGWLPQPARAPENLQRAVSHPKLCVTTAAAYWFHLAVSTGPRPISGSGLHAGRSTDKIVR